MKRIIVTFAAIALAVTTGIGLLAFKPAPVVADSSFNLVSGQVGLCLDVDAPLGIGNDRPNGTVVGMFYCTSNPNQQFRLGSNGEIKVFGNKCLSAGYNGQNMERAIIWQCDGGRAQKWTPTGNGELRSFNGRCLDIKDYSTSPGAPVQIYDCTGRKNQKWGKFVPSRSINLNFKLPASISEAIAAQSNGFIGNNGGALIGNSGGAFKIDGNTTANVSSIIANGSSK